MLGMISRSKAIAVLAILLAGTCMADDNWVVRPDGVGPVKIGENLSQLNTLLHEKFSMPESKTDQGCFYVNPSSHPHLKFMMVDGRLARVDVDAPGVSTVKGIQVGDSEAHALQVYGPAMKVEPHKYTGPEGHYLTVRSSSGRFGIRFETDKGKIQRFYAGRFEAVQYVEGCG